MIKIMINANKAEEADAVIISAPYEKTASFQKGTAEGPKKIIDCLNHQIDWFDRKLKVEAVDFIKTAHINLSNIDTLSPEEALQKINEACSALVSKNKFVFLLGGEHAVSLGHFQALSKKYNPKEVTILDIDAHCDLRNDDSDYNEHSSALAHSTVMRRASELGYNLVQVGIRTYHISEYEYFSDPKNNVTVFEWGNLEKKEKIPVEKILEAIKTKYIYISIDVDGFDPAHMPGAGTPVQGGIGWWYGIELLEKAIGKFELVGADIVEVSPQEDTVLTEYGAAQLLYTILANKFASRLR
jgi:agmatinase